MGDLASGLKSRTAVRRGLEPPEVNGEAGSPVTAES
jgi:hypothetical protein